MGKAIIRLAIGPALTLLLAAFACSPKEEGPAETGSDGAAGTGRGEPDAVDAETSPDDYVVYVDKLNLRNGAGTDGDVLAVLSRGDALTFVMGEEWVRGADGEAAVCWYGVEAEAGKGWVSSRHVVLRELFEDYGRADELGKAGKAGEMLEELARVTAERKVPGSPPESNVFVSPDLRKAVCWPGFVGEETHMVISGPYLYFEAGKGLADVFDEYAPDDWSDDSRYLKLSGRGEQVTYDTSSGHLTYGDN